MKPFFWIHIKKAAGTSMRKALGEAYPQVDRTNPQPFISLPREYWNDNLNNFRVPLGEYDYRRALFAKTFLFSDTEWNGFFKFAIIRNPYERIVSAFEYLLVRDYRLFPLRVVPKKIAFSRFVQLVPGILASKSPRHTATHLVPMMSDLSDEKGYNQMDFCARLENMEEDIRVISSEIGRELSFPALNRGRRPLQYRAYYTTRSKRLVEEIYKYDLEEFSYGF
jgi:hypothetical protein